MRDGLTIEFSDGEDGFIIAECLQLPGCMSQGHTQEEAEQNIKDAVESVLAVRNLPVDVQFTENAH